MSEGKHNPLEPSPRDRELNAIGKCIDTAPHRWQSAPHLNGDRCYKCRVIRDWDVNE